MALALHVCVGERYSPMVRAGRETGRERDIRGGRILEASILRAS
jgi:hypothetical protein